MDVFYSNILIDLKEDVKFNGVYRPETEGLQARRCEVLGIGEGYYDVSSDSYRTLPWKVGDELYVRNGQWIEIEHGDEKYLIARAESVMCRVPK